MDREFHLVVLSIIIAYSFVTVGAGNFTTARRTSGIRVVGGNQIRSGAITTSYPILGVSIGICAVVLICIFVVLKDGISLVSVWERIITKKDSTEKICEKKVKQLYIVVKEAGKIIHLDYIVPQ